MKLEIKRFRKKWFIFAGKSRLSKGFVAEGQAKDELENKGWFYEYWAGSASASIDNTEPVIIHAI